VHPALVDKTTQSQLNFRHLHTLKALLIIRHSLKVQNKLPNYLIFQLYHDVPINNRMSFEFQTFYLNHSLLRVQDVGLFIILLYESLQLILNFHRINFLFHEVRDIQHQIPSSKQVSQAVFLL